MKTRSAPEKTRRNTCMRFFYVGMAIVFGLVVFVGFSRTYYLKGIFGRPPLPLLAHLHEALFTSWIALFLIQALLVERNRTDLHRRLGLAGAVLASLMIWLARRWPSTLPESKMRSFVSQHVASIGYSRILALAMTASTSRRAQRRPA